MILGAIVARNPALALELTWTSDSQVLKNALLAGPPPVGITLGTVTITPANPNANEAMGVYIGFGLVSGSTTLTMPDGIVLTTGDVVREDGSQLTNNQETGFCGGSDPDPPPCGRNDYPGDQQIQALYLTPPNIQDGASITIPFTSDVNVVGLRLKIVFASEEFPEYGDRTPTPADISKQSALGDCFPDTFAAFLDDQNFGTAKDAQGHDVLMNVAQEVIQFDNNSFGGYSYIHDSCGPALSPSAFTEVAFAIEYDGLTNVIDLRTRIASPGSHVLKLSVTDVGPPQGGDGVLDTAAFLSSLEFVTCDSLPDVDGDGLNDDFCDNCPEAPNPDQADGDGDGVGDACDNCPADANPVHAEPFDCNGDDDTSDPGEAIGGQCDQDADGVGDVCDNCLLIANGANEDNQANSDGDALGDACDNCDSVDNPDQEDCDDDDIGDACELGDIDGDLVPDLIDNCVCVSNPDQADCDNDGVGNVCDEDFVTTYRFDFDADCDVDQTDFAFMQVCETGNSLTVSGTFSDGSCDAFDINGDDHVLVYRGTSNYGDVDLLRHCATGPDVPAEPWCGDCNHNGIHDARIDPSTFLGLDFPDFDYDQDDVEYRGRPRCSPPAITSDCDDNCPCLPNADQLDSDGDGVGDVCDPDTPGSIYLPDSDGDGIPDDADNCPLLANAGQEDNDGDGFGNGCDNCASAANPDQTNTDGDASGDACDPDDDNDGVGDLADNCRIAYNPAQDDEDEDGYGDGCDNCPMVYNLNQHDPEWDGVGTVCDNCPDDYNPDQLDGDEDAVGTVCDNCPADYNPDQLDDDEDGFGDVCDNCAYDSNPDQADSDSDGIGDACDYQQGLMAGGESMALEGVAADVEGEAEAEPAAVSPTELPTVTGSLAFHGSTATTAQLPAGGGFVVVDVVVANGEPITDAWGRIGVDAANAVRVVGEGWSWAANVAESAGLQAAALPSRYDMTALAWSIGLDADGDGAADTYSTQANALYDPAFLFVQALAMPLASVEAGDGWINQRSEDVYGGDFLGGAFAETRPAGTVTLATVTLEVAGVPGVYRLRLAEGSYGDTAGRWRQMARGPELTVIVGAP